MSDTNPIKLNLKALQKPEAIKEAEEIIEDISQNTLKEPSKIKIIIPQEWDKEKNWAQVAQSSQAIETTTDIKEWKDPNPIQEEEQENSKSHIKLDSINKYVEENRQIHEQKKENKKEQQIIDDKTEAENQLKNWKDDPKSEIHFNNYTSHFEKQSKNVFNKIRNFRYTPKTRNGLLVMLIMCTWVVIAGLMMFFPEKHSFTLYKASILEIYDQWWVTKWKGWVESIDNDIDTDKDLTNDTYTNESELNPEDDNGLPIKTTETDEATRKNKLQEHLINKYSG